MSMYFCSGLDEGLPCSYFHETSGLTEVQRIERYLTQDILLVIISNTLMADLF